jgi:uncharacterized membrane protein YjjP (DUF1212 family)
MDQKQILEVAIRAGTMLLRNGAEIYRVEDTMNRICRSYGLSCEAFVLPTGVFISVEGESGIATHVKRIPSRTVDLTRISQINNLSRIIEHEKPDYDAIIKEFEAIANAQKYSNFTVSFAYALTAFVYVLLFGGSLMESLSAVIVGVFLGFLRMLFTKGSSFPFIEYFVGGFASGILGSIFALLFGVNPYLVIIGAVTNLVPGVALTNGIRDLLHGDSVSGLTRLGEAIMMVLVIAAGTGIALAIWNVGGLI